MHLVPNWQQAWKWLSIRFIALAALWETLPPEAVAVIPDPWRGYVTLTLLILAGLGRVVDQGGTAE
jgi:hypothetical protein